MRIQIIEPGWEGFTGNMGMVDFEDGVSVAEVTPLEARRIANVVRVQTLEGVNPSSSQQVLDSQCVPMSVDLEGKGNDPVVREKAPQWSREQLEAIADAKGIEGLREIADPLGVKSKSIAKLVDLILGAQPQEEKQTPGAHETLLGSNHHASNYEIDGKHFSLGDIVALAFAASGLTVKQWNEASELQREDWIESTLQGLRGV